MVPHKFPLLWKGQDKMQKQRGLEQAGDDIAPVNAPIESVEFSGVVERIKNKRSQTENIKMQRTGRSPAPQQHIQADSKIDCRYQPQPDVERTFCGNQNYVGIQRYRLPRQRVSDLRPHPGPVERTHARGIIGHGPLIDRH